MAHELAVWLFDRRIGELALHNGRLQFRYSSEWLAAADASPLSSSLPLQSDAFDDHQTRPFFAGLLPEGHVRRLLARQLQVSGQNDFALLDHLGGECAGVAVVLGRKRGSCRAWLGGMILPDWIIWAGNAPGQCRCCPLAKLHRPRRMPGRSTG